MLATTVASLNFAVIVDLRLVSDIPYNDDGSIHDCKKKNGNGNNGNHSDISLEVVLKKLESIGITLDLEKLKKCLIIANIVESGWMDMICARHVKEYN